MRLFKSALVLISLFIIFDFAWCVMPDSFKDFIGIQMFYYLKGGICTGLFLVVLEGK
jgi:hypothetical protein